MSDDLILKMIALVSFLLIEMLQPILHHTQIYQLLPLLKRKTDTTSCYHYTELVYCCLIPNMS